MNAKNTPRQRRDRAFGDLSRLVIGCAMEVSKTLGAGFLESVYENALAVEFQNQGIDFERQKTLVVHYRSVEVGHFVADFVVAARLLVELKALRQLAAEHEAQVMNYLRATNLGVGLLLNFGSPRLGLRRIVWGYSDNATV